MSATPAAPTPRRKVAGAGMLAEAGVGAAAIVVKAGPIVLAVRTRQQAKME